MSTHAQTPDSIQRAKIRQLQERLAAGVDLETGRVPQRARPLVSICSWCEDGPEQTAAARANGYDVTHGICPACKVKFEAGAKP